MADYQEGHILTNKSNGQQIILQGNQWVPYQGGGAPAPQQANVAPTGPTIQPGKTPEVREPQVQNPTFLQDVGQTALPELTRGVMGLLTMPHTLPALAGQAIGTPIDTGWPSYDSAISGVEKHMAMPKPQTTGGKYVGTALQMLPGAGLGPGGVGAKALQWAGGALGSEALGQAAEGTEFEPYARMLGTLTGTTALPKFIRSRVTPNPYNEKMLADYNTQRNFVTSNTSFPESQKYLATINALKGGPVDVNKYRADAFAMLTPKEQAAAIKAGRPTAPSYTGPGAPPPAPPPSWTGAQVAHMDDALARDIAKGGPNVPQLTMLQKAQDDAMRAGTQGTPFQGSWADLKKQRAGLDQEVEQRLAGGGPGKALTGAASAVLANMVSRKFGMPGWGLEEMLMAGGAGLGGAGLAAKYGKSLPSFKDMIPGVADYRRNQLWQPGPATQLSPTRNAAMMGSGDLIFPALAHKPPEGQ